MIAPRFSVIIPTFNRRASLLNCLNALAGQVPHSMTFEVIVVVDGSTDGTTEMVGSLTMPFPLHMLVSENGGASRARNAGARAARGEYLAFTEDDVVPDIHWLSQAQTHLLEANHAILEGRTVYSDSLTSVRRFEPPGLPSFIPCNIFIKRDVFLQAGGYDEAYFDRQSGLYFREDSDLGFRLQDAGYIVGVVSDVIVSHPPQFETLGAVLRHVRRYVFDPLLYKRHPERYRRGIEVKLIGGIVVRRAQHYVALLDLAALLTCSAGAVTAHTIPFVVGASVTVLCGLLFRLKYHGRRAWSVRELHRTLGFWIVPFVYLFSVARGCKRYHSYGVLF